MYCYVYVYIFGSFVFYGYGDHRDLHVLTHSFPTRRSSDLTVWTSRYGKLGLKMIGSHDPAGTNCPRALIAKPTGVCIQLFAAMIQVAEMSVPSATMQVAKKCSRLPTLEMPNSITPRNPASRKKAVSTS